MSDMADQYHLAWVSVFDDSPQKLVFTWHVDRAWRGGAADRDCPCGDQAWQDANSGYADSKCKVGYPRGGCDTCDSAGGSSAGYPKQAKPTRRRGNTRSDAALPSGKLPVTLPKTPLPADALVEADEEEIAMGTNASIRGKQRSKTKKKQ